jgi:hypothetical protein
MWVQEREKKTWQLLRSQALFSWDLLNVRKEVRLMLREIIKPAYETK